MKEFNTVKLYYGFPIFILGYPDAESGYNITACSSSYSLGSMVVFGLGSDSNAAEQIAHFKRCSLNVMSAESLATIEKAGFLHKRPKLTPDIPHIIQDDVPILTDALLTIELKIARVETFLNDTNFTAHVEKRLVRDDLIENDRLVNENFDPVYFIGDQHRRSYRFLEPERSGKLGSYLRQQKKQ